MPSSHSLQPARVALVGVRGFGAHHLANLHRLQNAGSVQLVAVADPQLSHEDQLPEGTQRFPDLPTLLGETADLDVIILATPIQTHESLALLAIEHAHVYLEKPPVANLAAFEVLEKAATAAGRSIQVGFQGLGSHALGAIEQVLKSGEIGTLIGVAATGMWVRDRAYYKRSTWAGKRRLNGVDVVDGVATNPLAHAISTALCIAGANTLANVDSVETDLFHANDIESDDTSVIRIKTSTGLPITCALTLCAEHSVEPYITVQGSEGSAVLHYTEDRLSVFTASGERHLSFQRDDLTENLIEHIRSLSGTAGIVELISPLRGSGGFMRVLEAVRTAAPPRRIEPQYVRWVGEGDQAHAVVDGIEDALERSTAAHVTFSELGLPWAQSTQPSAESLTLGLALEASDPRPTIATQQSGTQLPNRLSPRPYLHPVRSLAGTVVTDHFPADHPWHLGVGVALQDVNGINFWGGKTYTSAEQRYEELENQGRISEVQRSEHDTQSVQTLSWAGPDGREILTEQRSFGATQVSQNAWQLDVSISLEANQDASLGSPGSNGARGSGYGGFFWRIAPCTDIEVFTATTHGEAASHGSRNPWLAYTARFGDQDCTLVFAAMDQEPDPWFVRVDQYPAVGSSLAWDSAVTLTRGQKLSRTFKVWIIDGRLEQDGLAALDPIFADK